MPPQAGYVKLLTIINTYLSHLVGGQGHVSTFLAFGAVLIRGAYAVIRQCASGIRLGRSSGWITQDARFVKFI
jgi:hypothetical protein